MARVPYVRKEDLPENERHLYERMASERGTGNIWRAIANHPKICDEQRGRREPSCVRPRSGRNAGLNPSRARRQKRNTC